MIIPADLPPTSSRFEPEAMLKLVDESGMQRPTVPQMNDARALAERLMGHEVVSLETLVAVQRIQPAATTVFVEDGKVTGVSGMLLLAPNAVEPLFAGEFDALNVDTRYLSRAGETPALGYCWGIAGATKRAAGAVLLLGTKVRPLLFPDLSVFTRAVTPVGRHLALNKHGYVPLRHPHDDLLIRIAERRAIAA